MDTRRFDELTALVAQAYRDYLSELTSTFEHLANEQGQPLQLAKLSAVRLSHSAARVVRVVMGEMNVAIQNAARRAAAEAGSPGSAQAEELVAFLQDVTDQFQEALSRAAERDLAAVRRALNQIVLRRRIGAPHRRVKPAFMQVDAAGRSCDSVDYLSLLARAAIVRCVVETFVYAGVAAGHTVFVARYPTDPAHRFNGQRFAPTAKRNVMGYEQALQEIFHPNTAAVPALVEG